MNTRLRIATLVVLLALVQLAPTTAQPCDEEPQSAPSTASATPVVYTGQPVYQENWEPSTCESDFDYGYYYRDGFNNGPSLPPVPPPPVEVKKPAVPDSRTARDYKLRKALTRYARENSVAGRLYVTSGSKKWLIQYDGEPQLSQDQAVIPCLGKVAGGQDQRLLLTLHFEADVAVSATVEPRL